MAASIKSIHVCEKRKGGISNLSDMSYLNIYDKINKWSILDGTEKEISVKLSYGERICEDTFFSGIVKCMHCSTCSILLAQLGYHSKCCSQFTDKNKIERLRKRLKDWTLTSSCPSPGGPK